MSHRVWISIFVCLLSEASSQFVPMFPIHEIVRREQPDPRPGPDPQPRPPYDCSSIPYSCYKHPFTYCCLKLRDPCVGEINPCFIPDNPCCRRSEERMMSRNARHIRYLLSPWTRLWNLWQKIKKSWRCWIFMIIKTFILLLMEEIITISNSVILKALLPRVVFNFSLQQPFISLLFFSTMGRQWGWWSDDIIWSRLDDATMMSQSDSSPPGSSRASKLSTPRLVILTEVSRWPVSAIIPCPLLLFRASSSDDNILCTTLILSCSWMFQLYLLHSTDGMFIDFLLY